jgi:outer membrane protein TolC
VDISLKEREIVQDRFDVGLANLADVLQAGMDLNMAEQNLASQQVFLDQQKINLLQLMGIRQFYDLTVNDSIIINRNLYRDSIMSYLETNPEYLGAWKQVKINEQLVKEIRAQRYPVLRLTTGYNYSYNSSSAGFNLFNQNYGPTLGASLQVPVFNGMIYRNQQDAAFINIENAELQKESIMLSLRAQALKTFEAYRSALEQIETQQKSYENAEKLVTLVLEKFKLSQVTILELKAAQASFENTAYRLVNLQFEAKIAEIELNRLTFRLGL